MGAGRIYLYYVLSSAATILAVMIAMQQNSSLTHYFQIEHPSNMLWSFLWLNSLPPYSELFVLYLIFTLAVVPAFLLAGERYRFAALATSGIIWLGAQSFSDLLAPLTHHLIFNPFAWQFLFVIGVFVARERDIGQFILRSPPHLRWLVLAACIIVVGSFLYKFLQARSGFDIGWLRIDPDSLVSMKRNLSPIKTRPFAQRGFYLSSLCSSR